MISRFLGAACLSVVTASASAQSLPAEPVSFGDGRVVISGDASVAIAPQDPGFFNYGDYEHSTLREFRVGISAMARATERLALLAEVRSDNLETPEPYALYARVRPFPRRRFDIQIGRIPPTFGNFARHAYARDNPLIGYPLAYQYLTSLRADALPASVDELLRMRGRGWLANYSIGNTTPDRGVPLVNSFTWDTGVQVSTGWRALDVTGALTTGSPSRPLVAEDNGGKTITTRVVVHASQGLVIGSSFARGAFVGRQALTASGFADDGQFVQQAYGLDVAYAVGHAVIRGEAIGTSWRIPFVDTASTRSLRAGGLSAEAKYAFIPGAYAAIRAERLTFNRVTGSAGTMAWDAPVSRIEVGGGYYLQRNLVARGSLQFNDRSGGRVTSARLAAAQLLFWF